MEKQEFFGKVIEGVLGEDGPRIVWTPVASAFGGAGFYWDDEDEFILLHSDLQMDLVGLFLVSHEAIHCARKQLGVEFYNRPQGAHHWSTICQEEHLVNEGVECFLKTNAAAFSLNWEVVGNAVKEMVDRSNSSYDESGAPYPYYLGLHNLGLTEENAETGTPNMEAIKRGKRKMLRQPDPTPTPSYKRGIAARLRSLFTR